MLESKKAAFQSTLHSVVSKCNIFQNCNVLRKVWPPENCGGAVVVGTLVKSLFNLQVTSIGTLKLCLTHAWGNF